MVEFALQDTPVVLGSIEFVKRILSTNQSSGIDEDILFTTWNALMFRPEVVPIEPYIELFTSCKMLCKQKYPRATGVWDKI